MTAAASIPNVWDLIDLAEQRPEISVDNLSLGDEMSGASEKLFFLLVLVCRGQALDLVVNAGQGEGGEVWRALYRRYEAREKTGYAGQLVGRLSWMFDGDFS